MVADARLRQVPIFAGLSEEDLDRICTGVTDRELAPGEVLFHEGDAGDEAYVVTAGEVEVVKTTARRDIRIATRGAGEVLGEIALIYAEPRTATVRARTATTLLAIPKQVLDTLLDTSPSAARIMFDTLGWRLRETHQETQQGQRMAQLGTLAIGIAHELNNPAAGVQRAARQLREELPRYTRETTAPAGPDVVEARARAAALLARCATDPPAPLSAMARSDREDELGTWLTAHGVADAWDLAPSLADTGLTTADIEVVVGELDGEAATTAVRFLVTSSRLEALTGSIVEGATRLSAIVDALKRHNYTDQAPVVDVDVNRGIEDTLLLLGHKVKLVRVERDYAGDLPIICGFGSDLNQVWTNLIDNACDALIDAATPDPCITVRTSVDGDDVVVEIEDNGPGIPAQIQERVFDAFFTTKPTGKGTGLGLQISARIALEHEGDLTVTSVPGRTTFRVLLPIEAELTTDTP